MHIYGLTGGIGSGKSTVSATLTELGCPIIDADVIARQVVEPGKPAWKLIIGHFGVDVLLPDGHVDRPKLARIIFEDEEKRFLLNSSTHPYIQSAMVWEVGKYFLMGKPFVVLVSPLLYESGRFLKVLKKIIVVSCTHKQQVERLTARDEITEEEALQRLGAQMPLSEKCRKADIVIDNSKDRDFTRKQVLSVYSDMKRASQYRQCFVLWILAVILLLVAAIIYFYL